MVRKPPATDRYFVDTLEGVSAALLRGELAGAGIVAVTKGGEELYYYVTAEADSGPVLAPALSKLYGLHKMNTTAEKRTNAPRNNRSYEQH